MHAAPYSSSSSLLSAEMRGSKPDVVWTPVVLAMQHAPGERRPVGHAKVFVSEPGRAVADG
jgi:hypothetical protein